MPTLVLGLLLSAQWQSQSTRQPLAGRCQVTLAEAALQLQTEQDSLKQQLALLRAELDEIQSQAARIEPRAAQLEAQIAAAKAAAGLSQVAGDGVLVTLDDARVSSSEPIRSIELAIVHSTDITDVINTAWKGGARAISVNGERITAASACVGAVIQINGTLLSPPFVFKIIGPTDRLLATFSDAGQLADQKRRSDAFGLRMKWEPSTGLVVPAYTGTLAIRYATPRSP